MTGIAPASSDATPPPDSEQSQAAALWTYVQLKLPRFSSATALEVVRRLAPRHGENPKGLAKRLRKELQAHGIALKHAAALQAAARLLGYESWFAAHREVNRQVRLQLTMLGSAEERDFTDWRALVPTLCAWCEAAWQEQQARVFEVRTGPKYLLISFQQPTLAETTQPPQSMPLLIVNVG